MKFIKSERKALLPNFLIIGAMKSGTTGLYDDLATHPDAWLPAHKEPDILHKATSPDQVRALYFKHFSGALPGKILGEASTMYTMIPWFSDVSQLARDTFGADIKLVYIMRDPLERIISHLAHDYAVGRIRTTDFDRLIWKERRYLALSDYATQMSPWINAFGTKNLLCLNFENYLNNRQLVTRQVAEFVGLDPVELQFRSNISNPRGSGRISRIPLIDQLVSSKIYRYGIVRALPREVLNGFKKLLTSRREVPSIQLSYETTEKIRAHFSDLGFRIESLGVGKFEW